MFGKPKLAPALTCILTFCIVSVVIVDANVPFGYIFVQLIRESDAPTVVKVLLPTPIVGLLATSFLVYPRMRGLLTGLSAIGLVILWFLGLVLFVGHPMYPPTNPDDAKLFPAVTSIPFVAAVIGTMWHSIRNVLRGARPNRSLDRSHGNRVSHQA